MATPWSGATWTPSATMNAGKGRWSMSQAGSLMWASGTYSGSGHWAFIGFNRSTYALSTEFDTGLTAANQNGTWATDGTFLYVMSVGSRVLHKFTTAGVGSTLATLPNQVSWGVCFDGTFLWTVAGTNGSGAWTVYRISLAGTITTYTSSYSGNLHTGGGDLIFTDGSYIYLADTGTNGLGVIPISSPTSFTALTTGNFANNVFQPGYFDGTNMWVAVTGPKLMKFPSGAGSSTLYTIATGAATPGVVYDGTNLWVSNLDLLASPTHTTLASCLPSAPTVQTDYYQYNVSGSPTAFYGCQSTTGDTAGMGRDNSGNAWAINYNNNPGSGVVYQVASTVPAPSGQLVYPFYKQNRHEVVRPAPGFEKHRRTFVLPSTDEVLAISRSRELIAA